MDIPKRFKKTKERNQSVIILMYFLSFSNQSPLHPCFETSWKQLFRNLMKAVKILSFILSWEYHIRMFIFYCVHSVFSYAWFAGEMTGITVLSGYKVGKILVENDFVSVRRCHSKYVVQLFSCLSYLWCNWISHDPRSDLILGLTWS